MKRAGYFKQKQKIPKQQQTETTFFCPCSLGFACFISNNPKTIGINVFICNLSFFLFFSISTKALGLVALMKFMWSVYTGVAPMQTYGLKSLESHQCLMTFQIPLSAPKKKTHVKYCEDF